jgi:choline dehydrogenase-like flavoprotein
VVAARLAESPARSVLLLEEGHDLRANLPVEFCDGWRLRPDFDWVSNQMVALVVTAPEPLRDQLRSLSLAHLVRVRATLRPGAVSTPTAASKLALRSLALRYQGLCSELEMLDRELARLTRRRWTRRTDPRRPHPPIRRQPKVHPSPRLNRHLSMLA